MVEEVGLKELRHSVVNERRTSSLEYRISQLQQLSKGIQEFSKNIKDAIHLDLGRPHGLYSIDAPDLHVILKEIEYTIKSLPEWMKPIQVSHNPKIFGPGNSFIKMQPKGVCLLIAPWNYPMRLTFFPLIACIAAGNSCVIKPSEVVPNCALVIEKIVSQFLDQKCFRVIQGDATLCENLLNNYQWDHIFYTGNGHVGRRVMAAAAKHLTPVTLELGGKSPVYIDRSANIEETVSRIANFKISNNGQACVAPDYVLVHKDIERQFIENLADKFNELISKGQHSQRVVNDKHFKRIANLLKPENHGGFVLIGGLEKCNEKTLYIPPTMIISPKPDSLLMEEEIFGPVLPIICVQDAAEAINFVNAKPQPLALYVFSQDEQVQDLVVDSTRAGGSCINNILIHLGNSDLPFGGCGPSGIGYYHGKFGFDELSNKRAVMKCKI